MKKLFAVFLALALCFTFVNFSFADDQENVVGNFNVEDCSTPIRMLDCGFDTIGSVFTTVGDCTRVAFVCPSWSDNVGNLTLTLWKWDTDFSTTIKAAPVKGPFEFEDYEDNSVLGFEFEEGSLLPAGTYYLELSGAVDDSGSGVGVWSASINYPGQAVLRDGEFIDKLHLRMYVDYATEPEGARYGALPKFNKTASGLGGDGVLPCEYYFKMSDFDLSDLDGEPNTNGVGMEQNEDGTLHVILADGAFDSQYNMNFALFFALEDDIEIPCQQYPYVALRLKIRDNSNPQGNGEMFMYTSTVSGATGGYSTAIRYDWSTTDWQTVVVDPTTNASFKKNAIDNEDLWLGFRYDVVDRVASADVDFDIDYIAFFESEEAALAFDGDFSKVEAEKPTKAPTAEPTEAPTKAPATEAPATDAPKPTDAPKATDAPEVTDAPETTKAPSTGEKKSNTGLIIGIVAGAVALAAIVAGIVISKSKKK